MSGRKPAIIKIDNFTKLSKLLSHDSIVPKKITKIQNTVIESMPENLFIFN
jgi:hypothetical protein